MRRTLRWLPFLVGMIAIWAVSSMSRPPIPDVLEFWNSDKLMHAAAYALLAAAAFVGASNGHHAFSATPRWQATLLAIGYGVVDELHQSHVPGRSPSVLDVLADGLGALLGAWIAWRVWLHTRDAGPPPAQPS